MVADLLRAFSRVGRASSGGQKNADLFILFYFSFDVLFVLIIPFHVIDDTETIYSHNPL